MGNDYAIVREIKAADDPDNGKPYTIDGHDLLILENGHALILIHDARIMDMSGVVEGGSSDAVVVGCVVQELDEANKLVFQWRSWDHIPVTDTNQPLDSDPLLYTHCNSIDLDDDGHILLGSRNLDEVTKINRQTGDIIWRLGGRKNNFQFAAGADMFSMQHDAKRLPNGNLSLFDNAVPALGSPSRGMEYRLDEVKKQVEKVAEFHNNPEVQSPAQGNMQRLPNGNTLIGWGISFLPAPLLTEFDGSGAKIMEMSVSPQLASYRALRFPWQGTPTWPPALIARLEEDKAQLYFSWNGSTETAAYKVYAGRSRSQLTQVTTVTRDGFESSYTFDLPQAEAERAGFWYFQVIPVDSQGKEGPPSDYAWVVPGGSELNLPIIAARAQ